MRLSLSSDFFSFFPGFCPCQTQGFVICDSFFSLVCLQRAFSAQAEACYSVPHQLPVSFSGTLLFLVLEWFCFFLWECPQQFFFIHLYVWTHWKFDILLHVSCICHIKAARKCFPWREAGDVWCLHPVWNLRSIIWFHFTISCLVLLPSPVTLSALSFFCLLAHTPELFQKILQYFSLRDRGGVTFTVPLQIEEMCQLLYPFRFPYCL